MDLAMEILVQIPSVPSASLRTGLSHKHFDSPFALSLSFDFPQDIREKTVRPELVEG